MAKFKVKTKKGDFRFYDTNNNELFVHWDDVWQTIDLSTSPYLGNKLVRRKLVKPLSPKMRLFLVKLVSTVDGDFVYNLDQYTNSSSVYRVFLSENLLLSMDSKGEYFVYQRTKRVVPDLDDVLKADYTVVNQTKIVVDQARSIIRSLIKSLPKA